MKLGGYVYDTIGHLSSFKYMSDFAWNFFYAGQHTWKTHKNSKESNNMPQNDSDVATSNNKITDMYMVNELGKPIVGMHQQPLPYNPLSTRPKRRTSMLPHNS